MAITKPKKKSDTLLAPLFLISTPLVWAVTTEEYRFLRHEQAELFNLISPDRSRLCSQVYRYDAMGTLKEASIPCKDGVTVSGGRKQVFDVDTGFGDAIQWFCKPFPEEGSPEEKANLTSAFGSETNFAPRGSVLVLFDLPSKLERKNGSKWSSPMVARALKNAMVSLIDEQKMIVLVSHTSDVPLELEHVVTVVEHPLPDQNEIAKLVKRSWNSLAGENEDGTMQTMEPISDESLELVVRLISGMRVHEAENILHRSVLVNINKRNVDPEIPKGFDIDTIRKEKTKSVRQNSSLDIIDPPGSLDQVAGLVEVKEWASEVKDLFSKAAIGDGIECPKGIVMCGPGGCGKTYTAACLGAFLNRTVLRWDVGASKDRYVGGTEGKVRQVFRDAKAQAPCILFIDEAGKLFPDAKGGQGASLDGGVQSGMYASLLTFMQETVGEVLVVMACNEDIMNFPAPALRAERIDKVFFVDLPTDEEVVQALRIHIKKKGWDPDSKEIDLSEVSKTLVDYTPAEIKTVVNRSLITKFHTDGPRPAELKTHHLIEAAAKVLPISRSNKLEIDAFRVWAIEKGYAKPAVTATPAVRAKKPAGRRISSALSAIASEEEDV